MLLEHAASLHKNLTHLETTQVPIAKRSEGTAAFKGEDVDSHVTSRKCCLGFDSGALARQITPHISRSISVKFLGN